MTAEADAIGWAVRKADGSIDLSSISPNPLAAMVTYLRDHDLVWSLNCLEEAEIEPAFKNAVGAARLIKVSIIEIDR